MQTYLKSFSLGGKQWTCRMEVSPNDMHMSWAPACPPESVPIWRQYERWRDQSLQDYACRSGILHSITMDIPQAGIRQRVTQPITREGAYEHYKSVHQDLTSPQNSFNVADGVRNAMAQDYAARMLLAAPLTKAN